MGLTSINCPQNATKKGQCLLCCRNLAIPKSRRAGCHVPLPCMGMVAGLHVEQALFSSLQRGQRPGVEGHAHWAQCKEGFMELGLWSPRQTPFSSQFLKVFSPPCSPESGLSCSLNPIRLQIRFSCSESGMLPKAKQSFLTHHSVFHEWSRGAVSKQTGAKQLEVWAWQGPHFVPRRLPISFSHLFLGPLAPDPV